MDSRLPHRHEPDPQPYSNDAVPPEDEEDEPVTETLMEVLTQVISVDPESGAIEGCDNTFTITEEVLRRHDQEEVTPQVLALLRAQGANCDCEVLLHSRIDLVFLEDDLEDEDDELDFDEADEEEELSN